MTSRFRPPNKIFAVAYRRFLHRVAGGRVLLLTTTGRHSGRPHTVGLQYEMIDDRYWVGAADGTRADWYRNILANPAVEIQVGAKRYKATAELVGDAQRAADFLAYRVEKHPLMLRMILRLDGVRGKITSEKLLAYATGIPVVIFTPQHSQQEC